MDEPDHFTAGIRVGLGKLYADDLRSFWSGKDPNCFARMISERRSLGYTDYTVTLGSEKQWIALLRAIAEDASVIEFFPVEVAEFISLLDTKA